MTLPIACDFMSEGIASTPLYGDFLESVCLNALSQPKYDPVQQDFLDTKLPRDSRRVNVSRHSGLRQCCPDRRGNAVINR
jgi:hypothetical protein